MSVRAHVNALAALFLSFFLFTNVATASIQEFRWIGSEDPNADLGHVISKINQLAGTHLSSSDFQTLENRSLATSQYTMLAQVAAGLPIRKASIRIWKNLNTSAAIQVEVTVEDTPPNPVRLFGRNVRSARELYRIMVPENSRNNVMKLIESEVRWHETDNQIHGLTVQDYWENGRLIRVAKIRGRRGTHLITVELPSAQLLNHFYKEFPKRDQLRGANAEFSVPAQIFPIYEETYVGSKMQSRVASELKYLNSAYPFTAQDPYAEIKKQKYYTNKYDPLWGMIPEGQAKGYWATPFIKNWGNSILNQLSMVPNTFGKEGVVLEGRYATVSLHPAVASVFKGLDFIPAMSAHMKMDWRETQVDGEDVYEMIPLNSLRGKPLMNVNDAWNRPAVKDPQNNPVTYINHGFDEVQVYYAVTALFESLNRLGFTDPDLSTRPFHAFLYDPDISMADNAYYTDDTINFTTYSPGQPNMARDNPTIWHELGHGIMDRVMGDFIQLADTGGLSEGMADFLAQLVVADVTANQPFDGWQDFRIINKTGFYLTNEVHDDGEAYGGAMKDLLDAAIAQFGLPGIHKVTDLTIEAMRLTRNHPALTANGWFEHMLFADSLGREGVRAPGELKNLIINSLNGRNFSLDGKGLASFSMKNGTQEIEASAPGTRENPLKVTLAENETASFELSLMLKNGEAYPIQYPVLAKAYFRQGPLQGAVHWTDEEKEPWTLSFSKEGEVQPLRVTASGTCDSVNVPGGGCVDYVYVHLFNNNGKDEKPFSKKRFYVRVKPSAP